MTQTVFLFASLKDLVGSSQVTLELEEPVSVDKLISSLIKQYPAIEANSNSILVSVNRSFADRNQIITSNDEVALFPPVSGG